MREFVAERVKNMPPSGIRKFFDVAATLPDVVSLGVGEPDFKTSERIREAAIQTLKEGKTRYTANRGLIELRRALSDYMNRRIGVTYDPETQIVVTAGASEGIDISMRVLCNPGDEILIPEPSYVSYRPAVLMAGGVPVGITTKVENEFRLTPEELEAAITPKTKAILLPYPTNPTGAIMEKEDLEAIAPILIKHDLMVISDEVYAELTYGGKAHYSIASVPGMAERTVVLNGFSKGFAMTGWRLGFACGPEFFMEQFNKMHTFVIMSARTTSQWAAVEALRDPELYDAEIATMRAAYDERRKYLVREFNRLGMTCFEPKGAFYAFPCIKQTGMTSEEFCTRLMYEERVALVPGNGFGESGEGFVRVSYAYSMKELEFCISKLEVFLKKLGCLK